jgi:hypothetical protein
VGIAQADTYHGESQQEWREEHKRERRTVTEHEFDAFDTHKEEFFHV